MYKKTKGQLLHDILSYSAKNAWKESPENVREKAFSFCDKYKEFLNEAKTERELTSAVIAEATKNGFICIDEIVNEGLPLMPGTKVYQQVNNKAVILGVIGKKPLERGFNIVGAHIDSPRIDLKQNPIYEDSGIVLFKTHYYGGIKKYHWVTIPLALHGVLVNSNGEVIPIKIGEEDNDVVFTITDLLPHLAIDQMDKKMGEAICGEDLNLLIGSIPYDDDKVNEKFKLNILKILNEKYNLIEEDFLSAEIEIVPAGKARDVGFDRSLIGAYGQDDRVCAYGAYKSLMDISSPDKTCICILVDKEEIGGVGNTGAIANLFRDFASQLYYYNTSDFNEISFNHCLRKSKMLSADVNPAVDPTYEMVHEKRNATYIGNGVVIQKYTGVSGKLGGNDANAEYLGYIRKLFNDNRIIWQTGEIGKVDHGGGGSVALFMANLGIDVVDSGIAILSMHSPFEVVSKIDIYYNYMANKVFYLSS